MDNIFERIQERVIDLDSTLFEAMKLMDKIKQRILFVYDDSHYIGMLTIGDIQRAIIKYNDTNLLINKILSANKVVARPSDTIEDIKENMVRMRAECMPVVDEYGELVDVVFWKDILENKDRQLRGPIDLPVVIMAGGKGTRLKPLTNVMPKPLIPISEKTILEEIMDRFENIGCKKFYMSVNYKYDMIEFYLNQIDHKYDISFFKEEKPLGTIGSVSLLKDKIKTPFFVSNCDIIIDQDFRDVYDYHCKNKNDITIVSAIKSFKIPYGVIETAENGIMTGLTEKPEMTYMINTGVYILQPELINDIPENEFYHITHLIDKVIKRGGKIGCFPVSENSWTDMGEWNEYLKLIK